MGAVTSDAVKSPDSGTSVGPMPDSTAFDELDLALIEALQLQPRAAWARIASVLGVDARTAARRWDRLRSSGRAWLTAYPAPRALTIGYLDVACRPDALDALTGQLCSWPEVLGIERTTGDHQLMLNIAARDLPALDDFVPSRLSGLDGVRSVRLNIAGHLYSEGSDWLVRALDQRQLHDLNATTTAASAGARTGSRASDEALFAGLAVDARRSCAELARDCGWSETSVRRRIGHMMRSGAIYFRCDIAHGLAGWPVIATYRFNIRADRLDDVGRTLAALPETRLCAAVTGYGNLVLSVWLRSPADCHTFEAVLSRRFPDLEVAERDITLHVPKRMGRLLGSNGVAIGQVPPAAWPDGKKV